MRLVVVLVALATGFQPERVGLCAAVTFAAVGLQGCNTTTSSDTSARRRTPVTARRRAPPAERRRRTDVTMPVDQDPEIPTPVARRRQGSSQEREEEDIEEFTVEDLVL
mmetsp:Transcript_52434/g.115020  ORF Transcript_52434/g.115020 Transcript_52434/m.115020 type:complete len:109 (+) Transcript_52434:48-374(+)